MRDLDAPYDRLQALPRALWLPTLITAAGWPARRLADVAQWLSALGAGELPDQALDFADAPALRAMRAQVAALELPALCNGAPALAEQVLRTMLWHLDRINDHLPVLGRADAIRLEAQGFRDEWEVQKGGWEAVLALMQGLGDLSRLSWDQLQGVLRSREWQEAQRISALLAHLRPLAELIRALGRAQHHPQRAATRSAAPHSLHEAMPQRERETRLPDAPGELKGIRHSDRLERMLGSEAQQIRHPVLHKLWRARLAESRLLTYESEAVLIEQVPDPAAQRHRAAQQAP
ncbi:MAG: VWA domain-containing protein, partial [Rhizobacter sp.]|nr:VWA domain-containing protein [Rhizobacter sp.]